MNIQDKRMIITLKKNNPEMLFVTLFFLPIINGNYGEIALILGLPGFTSLVYVVQYCLVLYALYLSIVKKSVVTLSVLGVLFLSIMLSVITTPGVSKIIFDFNSGSLFDISVSHFFQLAFLSVPLLLVSFRIKNISLLYRYFCNYSYITVFLLCVIYILQPFTTITFNYMTIAYNSLPAIVVLFYKGTVEKKRLALVFSISGMICIMLGGSRGALLLLIVTITFWQLFLNKYANNNSIKKMMLFVGVVILSILLFINWDEILFFFQDLFKGVGFSSRIFDILLGNSIEEGFFSSDTRLIIYKDAFDSISLMGRGIFSDRVAIGIYPHNIILELLIHFGWIGGSLIVALSLYSITKSFFSIRKSNNLLALFFWWMFTSNICTKMMMSASYLTDRVFWFHLGIFLVATKLSRRKNAINY